MQDMYYVNTERIQERLDFIPHIVNVTARIQQQWPNEQAVLCFAQERALHLAIELVTDVGHMLIDGFLMRDASSYEDIIEILQGESVLPAELAEELVELVKLRKPLIQDFVSLDREQLQPVFVRLSESLQQFSSEVTRYLDQELKMWKPL